MRGEREVIKRGGGVEGEVLVFWWWLHTSRNSEIWLDRKKYRLLQHHISTKYLFSHVNLLHVFSICGTKARHYLTHVSINVSSWNSNPVEIRDSHIKTTTTTCVNRCHSYLRENNTRLQLSVRDVIAGGIRIRGYLSRTPEPRLVSTRFDFPPISISLPVNLPKNVILDWTSQLNLLILFLPRRRVSFHLHFNFFIIFNSPAWSSSNLRLP